MKAGTWVRVKREAGITNQRTGTVIPDVCSNFARRKGIVAAGPAAPGWEVPVLIDGVRVSFLERELLVTAWEERDRQTVL